MVSSTTPPAQIIRSTLSPPAMVRQIRSRSVEQINDSASYARLEYDFSDDEEEVEIYSPHPVSPLQFNLEDSELIAIEMLASIDSRILNEEYIFKNNVQEYMYLVQRYNLNKYESFGVEVNYITYQESVRYDLGQISEFQMQYAMASRHIVVARQWRDYLEKLILFKCNAPLRREIQFINR